jgi:hypothetical protein
LISPAMISQPPAFSKKGESDNPRAIEPFTYLDHSEYWYQ